PGNCDELLFDDVIWVAQAKRDHFDFRNKMKERGVDVVEMHDLLTETVKNPEARKWILERKVTANQVGVGLQDELRAWLNGMERRQLAEVLIGGISVSDLIKGLGDSPALKAMADFVGATSFVLPPLPNTQFTRDTTCWIY